MVVKVAHVAMTRNAKLRMYFLLAKFNIIATVVASSPIGEPRDEANIIVQS